MEISSLNGSPTKEVRQPKNIVVIDMSLERIKSYLDNGEEFKELVNNHFPGNSFFVANSQYGFRGERWIPKRDKFYNSTEEALREYRENLDSKGVAFPMSDTSRPPAIYIQPGEREDSYDRSVKFALGFQERSGETFKALEGDIGAFSIYQIEKDGIKTIDIESLTYQGQGNSNKKFVPINGNSWSNLRVASIIFKVV